MENTNNQDDELIKKGNDLPDSSTANKRFWITVGGFFFLLLLAGAVLFASSNMNSLPNSEERVTRILNNPNEYYGNNVTVAGQIDDTIGTRAFVIDGPGLMDDQLLVISRSILQPIGGSGDNLLFVKDDRVRVNGRVREFNMQQIERELGVDLPDADFAEWEGRPVVIAEDVESNK